MFPNRFGGYYVRYHNIEEEPFEISGFPFKIENNSFNRLPGRIMPLLPDHLQWVAPQPSGGIIRFQSNARKLSLNVALLRNETSRNCTQALLSGFDVYIDCGGGYEFSFNICPENNPVAYVAEIPWDLPAGMKDFMIYMPLQNPVQTVKIGLDRDALIEKPKPFAFPKPILFYGSSITCGFCASRPGLSYPARITRQLNANLINFGFGGAAKGELEVANAISTLDLSCFVMDYDFNAPSANHLRDTHCAFYEAVRGAKPDLPIIIISAPFLYKDVKGFSERREIIAQTYETGIRRGDQNLYFIDGGTFFKEEEWADFTLDLVHPNDMGFARMTQMILPVIQHVFGG